MDQGRSCKSLLRRFKGTFRRRLDAEDGNKRVCRSRRNLKASFKRKMNTRVEEMIGQ